jgi:beta-galactosidase
MSKPARPHRTPASLDTFLYGVAYYPEHWDQTVRDGDPALFADAGYNVVRMAEFAWDLVEPEPGRLDFSLFDATLDKLHARGIRAILCTPTAAPPRWLTLASPEVLAHDHLDLPLAHGSRQHISHFSPAFRAHSRRITAAMAAHFAPHPAVVGWQTDNEFHCHFAADHSPAAQIAFQTWLDRRYAGSIAALNQAWGTAFWAQTYHSFAEVPTPRPTRPTYLSPAHLLDYSRFLADGVAAFQREQIDLLRAANPRWFVTHNGCFNHIDFAGDFSRDLDFLGYDSYPFFEHDPALRAPNLAFNTDFVRAYSGNFVILEQQSGPGGQGDYLHDNPVPGEMRRFALANIARGADGLLFFRERSCRFGAEEFWCGVLDHDNIPRRRYREAARLGAELRRAGPALLGTSVEIDVAVAGGDFDSHHGHLALSHGLPTPKRAAGVVHGHYYRSGRAVGCVHPGDDLSGLRLYLVPHLALFDPSWLPGWESWVRAGGVIVVGARTATKDLNNNVVAATAPGVLRPLVGATVEESGRQNRPDLRPRRLRLGDTTLATELWYEQLAPDPGVEVLATWLDDHLAGTPAITLRRLDRGAVLYVGTYFTPELLAALDPVLVSLGAPATPPDHVPGLEHVVRSAPGRRLHFYLNHTEEELVLPFPPAGRDLLADQPVTAPLRVPPGEVVLIHENS